MEAFAEKLKASAAHAAKVAQNLATTGFDEMAATDEYVQSEGFNVAASAARPQQRDNAQIMTVSSPAYHQQQQQQQQQEQQNHHLDLHDDASTLSTHSSAWLQNQRREAAKNRSSLRNDGPQPPLSRSSSHALPPDTLVPLKVNVPERRQLNTTSGNYNRQEDNASLLSSSDNDDNSSDDDYHADPIMSLVRKQHGQQPQQCNSVQRQTSSREGEDDESSFSERHLPHNNTDQRRKKTNRFMEDLESRMAMPEPQNPQISFSSSSATASPPPPHIADRTTFITSWLSTAATSVRQLAPLTGPEVGRSSNTTNNNNATAPLARNKRRVQQNNGGLDDVAIVISSSAMLRDEEMLQLRQQQQQSAQYCGSPPRLIVVGILNQHPREAFILFTLLLGTFLYFYSSNRSLED